MMGLAAAVMLSLVGNEAAAQASKAATAARTPAAPAAPAKVASELARDVPRDPEMMARGDRLKEELGWPNPVPKPVSRDFQDMISEHLLPGVYGRGGLTPRERELVVMAIIITQGAGDGIGWHFREVAHRNGLSEREVREVIYTACFYAGWPKCSNAEGQFGQILREPGSTWPKELLMSPPATATTQAARPAAQ
jgi:4-carboxymuconolactone decarboxylase